MGDFVRQPFPTPIRVMDATSMPRKAHSVHTYMDTYMYMHMYMYMYQLQYGTMLGPYGPPSTLL